MVIKEYRDMVLEALKDSPEAYEKVKNLPCRRSQKEPPPGGISINAASRKYDIPNPTIVYWRRKGWINTLLETPNEIYVSEEDVARLKESLSQKRKRGSKEITRYLKKLRTNPTST